VLLSGGIADLVRVPATTEGVLALGYPDHFLTILGVWKVLGAIAILAPRFPRLKEWAYAGSFFDFTGAIVAHTVSGSNVDHVIWTSLLRCARSSRGRYGRKAAPSAYSCH